MCCGAKRHAPWIAHIHDFENPLTLTTGLRAGCRAAFSRPVHQLGHARRFLLIVVAGERFAVLLCNALDDVAVHEEVVVLFVSVLVTCPLESRVSVVCRAV